MKNKAKKLLHLGHDAIFKKVHSKQLIYNTCWEDPRIDRELMKIEPSSRIVMITSAGCNALDYLLDNPAEINAVDINPRQNALIELKMAFFKAKLKENLWNFFGLGADKRFKKVFQKLKGHIPSEHLAYWGKNISYFHPGGLKKTFYYRGTAGTAAWVFKKCVLGTQRKMREKIFDLFEAKTFDEQKELYLQVEKSLWNFFMSWFIKQPLLMTMLGVPRPQIDLITKSYSEGLLGYVKEKMRQVFTDIPIRDNYFWRVYLHGFYTKDCCPNYLKEEHFDFYAANCKKIKTYSSTISSFLKNNPSKYSHYVLLDHQDWMAYHSPEDLTEEWNLILENSRPGTKILFRSAGNDAEFIPKHILDKLIFHTENSERLHKLDRVGTYASLHFAEVK